MYAIDIETDTDTDTDSDTDTDKHTVTHTHCHTGGSCERVPRVTYQDEPYELADSFRTSPAPRNIVSISTKMHALCYM